MQDEQATPRTSSTDVPTNKHTPIALTIAGSDSGGGAGIQADLKTFSALGVYGASAITALTAQNTQTVTAISEIPTEFVTQQLAAVLSDLDVCAIKIGMLFSVSIIEAVSAVLREHTRIPVVLDPVMIAKSGDALLQTDAVDAMRELLCPLATVVTPNIPEAACLLKCEQATTLEQMLTQARSLSDAGQCAVLIKGGHLDAAHSTDILYQNGTGHHFEFPRIPTMNTHGTGCTLSSAVAAGLARRQSLFDAVSEAERYVHAAIASADKLQIGKGHGPVHHFHSLWHTI